MQRLKFNKLRTSGYSEQGKKREMVRILRIKPQLMN